MSEEKVTIDGTEYNLDDLSDNAKALLQSIQVMDQELERAQQQQVASLQTARSALQQELSVVVNKDVQ